MSKILLIDIDRKILNLALKKIEKYHTDKGDEVIWNNPLMKHLVDKIYVSCIFDWNKDRCKEWYGAEIGGTGYSLSKKLPSKIEKIKPRINLGFTTRGCIRNCNFCVVPLKEGKFQIVGDIYDIWDGKTKNVILLDNNILASIKHFKKICSQARKEKLRVDFNQGLDCRLLTDEVMKELNKTQTTVLRFAFDNPSYLSKTEKAIDLLLQYKKQAMWYVLVGFDTTFDEDLSRVNYLHSRGQRAYIMRHANCKSNPWYIQLARWVNSPYWRNTFTWEEFLNLKNNKLYLKKLYPNNNQQKLFK